MNRKIEWVNEEAKNGLELLKKQILEEEMIPFWTNLKWQVKEM